MVGSPNTAGQQLGVSVGRKYTAGFLHISWFFIYEAQAATRLVPGLYNYMRPFIHKGRYNHLRVNCYTCLYVYLVYEVVM